MRYKKIESIKKLQKYGLPILETIFIFDFRKQEKELDKFLQNKEYVAIRTDTTKKIDSLPCNLRCHKKRSKKIIKDLNTKGFAVILHEQDHIPFGVVSKKHISGNIAILQKCFIVELMRGEPLYRLNREGRIDEHLKIKRNSLEEIGHWGRRIISKRSLDKILKMIRAVPAYKIVEFTSRPEGFYFWQIRNDKTIKKLDEESSL